MRPDTIWAKVNPIILDAVLLHIGYHGGPLLLSCESMMCEICSHVPRGSRRLVTAILTRHMDWNLWNVHLGSNTRWCQFIGSVNKKYPSCIPREVVIGKTNIAVIWSCFYNLEFTGLLWERHMVNDVWWMKGVLSSSQCKNNWLLLSTFLFDKSLFLQWGVFFSYKSKQLFPFLEI